MELSIIIPVYNGEVYLAECLDSMTRQGFCEGVHEVVIVDDGSTDSSPEIALRYCENFPYCRLIQTENQGVSAARNIGILNSSGKYIAFMDADDFFADDSYLPLLQVMKDNKLDLVMFGCARQKDELQKIELSEGKYRFCGTFYSMSVWSSLYKREIIIENDLLFRQDQLVFEDYLFSFMYSHYVKNGCAIFDTKAYYYRSNFQSVTGDATNKKQPEIRIKALRKSFNGSFIAMKAIKEFYEKNGHKKGRAYDLAISTCLQTHLLISVYLKEKPRATIAALNDIGFSLRDLKIKNIEGLTIKYKIKSEIMYLLRYRLFFELLSFLYRVFK